MAVRVVNNRNLREEFEKIDIALRKNRNSFVSLDTEFPGTIFRSHKPFYNVSQQENYALLRDNVNGLKLIQLGITLCDQYGKSVSTWEFNFRDFDVEKDPHSADSIKLLKDQGIDFATIREEGIRAVDFARQFLSSGLGCSLRSFFGRGRRSSDEGDLNLTWVFFHCTYDLGYLIKLLTQKPLPENPADFVKLVRMYLGHNVFDLKEMVKAEPLRWNCGLNKVAENLQVKRTAGESHQAGSDSLVTIQCFLATMKILITGLDNDLAAAVWRKFNYKLHGLEFDELMMAEQNLMQKRKIYQYPTRVMYHPYAGRAVGVHVPIKPINAIPLVPVYGL